MKHVQHAPGFFPDRGIVDDRDQRIDGVSVAIRDRKQLDRVQVGVLQQPAGEGAGLAEFAQACVMQEILEQRGHARFAVRR